MKRIALLLPLLLLAPLASAQSTRVTREAATAALRGDCLRTGDVGYPITLDHDIAGQLMLVTGAVANQRIILATERFTAPAGFVDAGPLTDMDHREYRLFVEPRPRITVCPGAGGRTVSAPTVPASAIAGVSGIPESFSVRVVDSQLRSSSPNNSTGVKERKARRWWLAPLAIFRLFGLNSRGEYTQ